MSLNRGAAIKLRPHATVVGVRLGGLLFSLPAILGITQALTTITGSNETRAMLTGPLFATASYWVAVGTGATGAAQSFLPGGAVNPTATPLAEARGNGDVAALTFDDGPNPGETDELLDFLAEHDILATFCVIGQNVTADRGAIILRRIVNEGHTLCNHATSYADMGDWTQARVEADLTENLAIIREAVGDPEQPVPYFRAPNGSWGHTPRVAAELGMQPLALGNTIADWDGNDLSRPTLTSNLRKAMTPGAVVLVHDGGGDRRNSIAAVRTVVAERIAEDWTFTLPAGGIDSPRAETDRLTPAIAAASALVAVLVVGRLARHRRRRGLSGQ